MRKILLSAVIVCAAISVYAQAPSRKIDIDFRQEKGMLDTFFNECVGAGRANSSSFKRSMAGRATVDSCNTLVLVFLFLTAAKVEVGEINMATRKIWAKGLIGQKLLIFRIGFLQIDPHKQASL